MKIFRKIRQAFIQKGNLTNYLWYAIGEILLVMIGILLALQVNNWNENKIKRSAELTYYSNIKNRLLDDKKLIQSQINFNNRYGTQFKYANEIIEINDRTKTDTLGKIAINLTNYSDFDGRDNIYESMVNSGEIKLLKNNEIIEGIRDLEEDYLYINRIEKIHYDAMITYAIPNIYPNIKFSTGEVKKPDLVYRFEFQNLILSLLKIMKEKDQKYNSTIEHIDMLLELINNELEAKG
jgi:hypothetical protein